MEIKIKDQDKLIDATLEVVDGVMIVSSKDAPFVPRIGDKYFTPAFRYMSIEFVPEEFTWNETCESCKNKNKRWEFRTEEECQQFCNKLNQAINSIKP